MALVKYGWMDPSKLIIHTCNGFAKLPDACRIMDDIPMALIKSVVDMD